MQQLRFLAFVISAGRISGTPPREPGLVRLPQGNTITINMKTETYIKFKTQAGPIKNIN